MDKRILSLRFAYWLGMLLDAGVAGIMIFPSAYRLLGWPVDMPVYDALVYGLRFGSPCMAGWTVLLWWANRKPVERRDILLITLIPVISMYTGLLIYTVAAGYAQPLRMIPGMALQALQMAVYVNGVYQGRRLARSQTSPK